MALKKQITLDSGIVVNYHRINSIDFITNWSINISISSYISKEQRDKEAQYQAIGKKQIRGEKLTPEEFPETTTACRSRCRPTPAYWRRCR